MRLSPGLTATCTFRVLDVFGTPVSGLGLTDFIPTFVRRSPSDSAYAAAAETLTITSRGSGYHDAEWTVAAASEGYQYFLSLVERNPFPTYAGSVVSAGAEHVFTGTVEGVEIAAESDCFCSVSDVEALVQRGPFSTTTHPTRSEVLNWMAETAAEIESVMAEEGEPLTVAAGTNPIDTSDDYGRRLALICRRANALKPASEALLAHGAEDTEKEGGIAAARAEQYEDALKKIRSAVQELSSIPDNPEPPRDEANWSLDTEV